VVSRQNTGDSVPEKRGRFPFPPTRTCPAEAFIDRLEAIADRPLRFRPISRPHKSENAEEIE